MASEGVIKIKGDVSEFIRSLDETQRKMVEVGEHAKKVHSHAKTFGEAWEHANMHMAKSVVHALSLGGALKESVNLMREYAERAREASTKTDDLTVKRSLAAAKLGMDDKSLEALTGAGSPVEAKDLVGLATKLAEHGANSSVKTGRRVTPDEVIRALGLARQGILSPDEIADATLKGQLGNMEGRNRDLRNRMSPEAREILESRTRSGVYKEQTEEKDAAGGRSFGERYDWMEAALARRDGFSNLPGFRQFFAAMGALQGIGADNPTNLPAGLSNKVVGMWDDPNWNFSGGGGKSPEEHPVVKELQKQTDLMTPPPTVSPGVH